MHEICDMQHVREPLTAALRTALQDAPVTTSLVSVTVRISRLDPIDWLAAQSLFPQVYWKARHDFRAYAAVGEAARITAGADDEQHWQAIEAFLDRHPDVTGFYGSRFDALRDPGPEWQGFDDRTFLVPEFLLEADGDDAVLRANVSVAPDAGHDHLLEVFSRRLDQVVLRGSCPPDGGTRHAVSREWTGKGGWQETVRALTTKARHEEIEKVVLARRLDVTFEEPPAPLTFMRQFSTMKSPAYFFCWQPAPGRAFLGSSPEQLFERTERRVCSEALAGTRPRGGSKAEDAELRDALLSDPKERHEHGLVHDHIRKVLGPLCEQLASDENPSVLQLILVQHLLQNTAGTLRPGTHDGDLARALHPTPAVGGVPSGKALELIRSLEPFDRGWYAAPVGVVSREHTDLTVAIRSGLLHGNTLSLYCGAGIVAESDPETEWQETEIKFANFLNVIRVE